MSSIGQYTQDELTEIWDSLETDSPAPNARKVSDDEAEQAMSLGDEKHGVVNVVRTPGGDWKEMPGMNEGEFQGIREP